MKNLSFTRHSCATRLLQGGLDIYRVKDWLGHKNISTTEKYAKLVPTNLVSDYLFSWIILGKFWANWAKIWANWANLFRVLKYLTR